MEKIKSLFKSFSNAVYINSAFFRLFIRIKMYRLFTYRAFKFYVAKAPIHLSHYHQAKHCCSISHNDGEEFYIKLRRFNKILKLCPDFHGFGMASPLLLAIHYAYNAASMLSEICFISYLDNGVNVDVSHVCITVNRWLKVVISEESSTIPSADFDETVFAPKKCWDKGFFLVKNKNEEWVPFENIKDFAGIKNKVAG